VGAAASAKVVAAVAAVAVAAVAAVASTAAADPCTGGIVASVASDGDGSAADAAELAAAGGRFATCFDPGNRLAVDAGTLGLGGVIALRNDIHFTDEPDLVWKMEHELLGVDTVSYDGTTFTGRLYRGVFIRHSRDGHVVLPFGDPPAKLWLPFDVGALVEVGELQWRPGDTATLGVVRTAALVDLARSRDHRLRLALGPVAEWDVDLARTPEMPGLDVKSVGNVVAPFTSGVVDVRAESSSGLDVARLRLETGWAWYGDKGWLVATRAQASVERTLVSVNDRPLAAVVEGTYDSAVGGATLGVALRMMLVQKRDPRVHMLEAN
jgi:hypothetical protein